ncbi:RAD55 family ATPase [Candidatus Methanoperedens nitratireducens]|uniref:Putative circadian clock protein, KaiC n=1 Tax=Candidatus Methanoperedens nitratireducens TaxID=1392998 RepID=A0A284VTI3_9EURY|nr:ATPase domain-containing protein [Candidatus Methanoperedens nitroreducens]SNQ62498.1 putative circadian clock protein, KaiC [Candidatus Methanoperedens nitroreducens]
MKKTGRVSTGIYGLDDLMGGGFRENTINIVRGGTGVGKTTFALQYSLFGLNRGEKVVYISFEMSEEQIVRDCRDIGWEEIEHYIEQGDLKIIHLFGEDLTFPSLDVAEIVRKALPPRNLRLVIDPLTYPTFYSEKEKRKSLSTIFKDLRIMGTVVIALEDPADGNHISEGSAMPLYLADSVIYMQNLGFGEMYDRTLRIMKHRGSRHGDSLYPYTIETGLGVVIQASQKQVEKVKPKTKFADQFKEAIERTRAMGSAGERLSARIEALQKNWTHDEDPSQLLRLVLEEEKKGHGKRT